MTNKQFNKVLDTMKKILILVGIYLLIFTIVMIVTFWVKGSVPDTLITAVFGGSSIELVAMSGIKIVDKIVSKKYKLKDEEE